MPGLMDIGDGLEWFLKLKVIIILQLLNLSRVLQQVWAVFTAIFLPWVQGRLLPLIRCVLETWKKIKHNIYCQVWYMVSAIMVIVLVYLL